MNDEQVKDKAALTFEALERYFPGQFLIDPDCQAATYAAAADGMHACDYEVRIQVRDGLISVLALAPIRFTKESVGCFGLQRVNEYIQEACTTGLCSVLLTSTGRLGIQHHLFSNEADVGDAIRMVVGFLDCHCIPLLMVAMDERGNPRKAAFEASRKFTSAHGFGILATLKILRLKTRRLNIVSSDRKGENHGF